jgi:hypothetical protein
MRGLNRLAVTSESERSATHPPAALAWVLADRYDVVSCGRDLISDCNHLGGRRRYSGRVVSHSLITRAVSINARSSTRGRRRLRDVADELARTGELPHTIGRWSAAELGRQRIALCLDRV